MKKIVCLLLLLIFSVSPAFAQSDDTFTLWFEEGFSLAIPEGWVSYPVNETAAESDIRYILSDGEGAHFLYIFNRESTHTTLESLNAALTEHDSYEKTGDLTFCGQQFLAFIDSEQNISGCMTLLKDELLSFIFTPQNDSDYMLLAASIMNSYSLEN